MPTKLLFLVVAICTSSAASAFAGPGEVTIVFETRNRYGDHITTHYYGARRARFDSENESTCLDFATGRVVRAFLDRKEFWETSIAEIEAAMNSVSLEMQKAMEGIPPSLRHEMMGDAAGEVTASQGEIRNIAGHTCRTHVVSLSEKNRLTTCVTTSIPAPFAASHFRNIAIATTPVGPGNSGLNKLAQKMREIKGFSLASSMHLSLFGRKFSSESVATEIRLGPIDPAVFNLPEGLLRVPSPFSKPAR